MKTNGNIRILAFDPGELTGISFIIDGKFIWGMTSTAEPFTSESIFPSLVKMTQPTHIIIESPPDATRFKNEDQIAVYRVTDKWFRIAGLHPKNINPGQWKHLIKRSKISAEHVKDATDIGMWFHKWILQNEHNS